MKPNSQERIEPGHKNHSALGDSGLSTITCAARTTSETSTEVSVKNKASDIVALLYGTVFLQVKQTEETDAN